MTGETLDDEVRLLELYLDSFKGFAAKVDGDGACRYISRSYKTVTGYEPSAALEQSVLEDLDLVHPDDRSRYREAVESTLRGSTPAKLEYRFLRSGGQYIWLESVSIPLADQAEKPGGIAILSRDITENKKADEEITLLAERVIRDDEEVRREVATDLHDVVAQDLHAVRAALEVLLKGGSKVEDVSSEVRSISDTVGGTILEVRSLSSGLRPEALEHVGLAEALREHVDGFGDRTRIAASFQCNCEHTDLTGDRELAVFRIAQESLMNVYRHSGASRVEVSLDRGEGKLALTVTDDGQGFEPDAKSETGVYPAHLGLLGMRERARMARGKLSIQSSPGKGTVVRLDVPVG